MWVAPNSVFLLVTERSKDEGLLKLEQSWEERGMKLFRQQQRLQWEPARRRDT